MFGHLRVNNARLACADRSLYRAHFCAVCHNLRAFGGWDASLLTNYDVTLWSLVASGISVPDHHRRPEWRPCTALPLRHVQVQPLSPEVGATLASLTVLLAWAKLEDHRQDGGRLLGWMGQRWLGRKESKAREYLQRQGYPLQTLLQLPERQAAAESQPRPSLESLAHPTRDALADAFEWIGRLAERLDLRADLRALGSGIAHYVYLWDALEDFEDDRRSGRFNALMAIWGPAFPPAEVRALLLGTLASLEQSLGRLPLGSRRKLVGEVVESMRAQTLRHPDLRQKGLALPSLRARQRKAGFLHTADTDCDCGDCCCEVGCCDHGQEGCNCCEISCCDEKLGDSCCEFDCCDCFCCCHNQRVGTGSPCGQGLLRGISSLFEAPASPSSEVPDERLCPACRFETVKLPGQAGAHRCSNCGGIWVDGAHSTADIDLKPLTDPKHKVRPPGIARGHRHCSYCQVLLSPAVDPARPETCPECQGRFYERPLDSRNL